MPRIAIIGYGVVGRALGAFMIEKVQGVKFLACDAAATGRSVGKVRIAKTIKDAARRADTLEAKALIAWAPMTSVKLGVRNLMEYFKSEAEGG
jgi:hypothetical protein